MLGRRSLYVTFCWIKSFSCKGTLWLWPNNWRKNVCNGVCSLYATVLSVEKKITPFFSYLPVDDGFRARQQHRSLVISKLHLKLEFCLYTFMTCRWRCIFSNYVLDSPGGIFPNTMSLQNSSIEIMIANYGCEAKFWKQTGQVKQEQLSSYSISNFEHAIISLLQCIPNVVRWCWRRSLCCLWSSEDAEQPIGRDTPLNDSWAPFACHRVPS